MERDMAQTWRLLQVNEEIRELLDHEDSLTEEEQDRLEYLRNERQLLESALGDQVRGLKGYYGGPA